MEPKKIKLISTAEMVNMDGNLILQALPIHELERGDPILLIHHWKTEIPAESRVRELGVAPHPHRGFSPVTFVFEGAMEHRDSRGNRGVVGPGGAQWMHAGMGIMHSERPPKELAGAGGMLELIQFWVNVPSQSKMIQPSYQNIPREEIPVISSEQGLLEIRLVAGTISDTRGPAQVLSPVTAMQIYARGKDQINFEVGEGQQMFFYALDGLFKLNGKVIGPTQVALLPPEGTSIGLEALEAGRAVLVGGKPIEEPVLQYGPYVVTNQTEVLQAMRDYQLGKMGILIEDF
ncbi:MAG: pirin family protein [Saprospiraceae bacterium]|nr:pirin family protein [Saprospiraceae bacterium]MCB9319156.1 pirin family protein [Lewinellaceae bacterium]